RALPHQPKGYPALRLHTGSLYLEPHTSPLNLGACPHDPHFLSTLIHRDRVTQRFLSTLGALRDSWRKFHKFPSKSVPLGFEPATSGLQSSPSCKSLQGLYHISQKGIRPFRLHTGSLYLEPHRLSMWVFERGVYKHFFLF